jgi:hypothetical protein
LRPFPRELIRCELSPAEHRRELLKRDLLSWGSEYCTFLEHDVIVPIRLTKCRHNSDIVRQCLLLNPDRVVEYAAQSVEKMSAGSSSPEELRTWKAIIEFCVEQNRPDLAYPLEKKLFEFTAPAAYKLLLYGLEIMIGRLTFSTETHTYFVQKLRAWAYHTYVAYYLHRRTSGP